MLSEGLCSLVVCMLCNDWCLTSEKNYPYEKNAPPGLCCFWSFWLADVLCLTVVLHFKCHCGILTQHTSVPWHHPHRLAALSSRGERAPRNNRCSLRCAPLVWMCRESVQCESSQCLPPLFTSCLSDDRYVARKVFGNRDLEKCTFDIVHVTHSFPTPPSHQRDIMSFLNKAFCVTVQFLLSSRRDLLHSWNSWDCGDQVACEAT